ncbi:MAG: GHKL domain-containing protein [Clostridium sp.]|nr:GHKL domain-containing protein [Clostridium sp.]
MSQSLFNVLYPLFSTLLISIPLCMFIDILKNKFKFITYLICMYLVLVSISNISKEISIILSAFIFITFLYTITRNVVYSTSIYILINISMSVSDSIVGNLYTLLLNVSFRELESNSIFKLFVNIPILVLTLLFCFLIKKLTLKVIDVHPNLLSNKSLKKFIRSVFAIVIIIYITYAVLFAITYKITLAYDTLFFEIIYSLSAFTIIILLVIVAYILINVINISNKQELIDKENKQLKDYTNMLESMSSDLRRFKHDYVNILYTLGDYINEEDIHGLQEFYRTELLPESNKIVNRDKYISLLKNIKIMPLKALISSKILIAQSHGIETRIEIFEEIDKISIKTIDICRIIGIFLDNAIEATSLCEKKFIHFAAIKNDDNVIIVILNSCSKDCPPIYKLYENNFTTKGGNHGIGLKFVKELINSEYRNILLNTSVNNEVFKQELIIENI